VHGHRLGAERLIGRDHLVRAAGPPAGLPGLDPSWSRLVDVEDTGDAGASEGAGDVRRWHVLDNGVPDPVGTLLCVHGNPTWSYLWRHLLAAAPAGWRVVAPDHLGMGYSERTASPRILTQRIEDLSRLTDALGVTGPVVTVAHDWGGPISLGWALEHPDQLAGVVLTNTAVHQPVGFSPPALIRLARHPAVLRTVCERTPVFVRAATALSRPPLPAGVRAAFAAPYAAAARRRAVRDFVADIPLDPSHPSAAPLAAIAAGLHQLADTPALILWGPRDPVFTERHLRDLLERLPHAQVHRYDGASHLVTEDRPASAAAIADWVAAGRPSLPQRTRVLPEAGPSLDSALLARATDGSDAVVEMGSSGVRRRVSFALLARRVEEIAAGLVAAGVRPGDRVALLVPPGADLTAAVYACWRAGALIVVADAGLGVRGMRRALRAAAPDHVIGVTRGLALAATLRLPGRRIAAGLVATGVRLGADTSLAELARTGRAALAALPAPAPLPEPDADAECAVVFTSGATGPAKGVVYRRRQLLAQIEALRATYDITAEDKFVAAFAPFALYGPALGITTAVPAMDVTAPGTLSAAALADTVAAAAATMVFASPAALRNVVDTARSLDPARQRALERPRLVLSAGAPVPPSLLRQVGQLMPGARLHTPYGMTEALPIADVDLDELDKVGAGGPGVCVGRPVPGVDLAVSPVSADGRADGALTGAADVTGEVCVRAPHVKERYDRLWVTERVSSRDPGWHRTGDVGHLDEDGRLWVEGRLVHVVTTAAGPVTPVGPERRIEGLDGVLAAAVVGVGPAGTQAVVAVVVPQSPPRRGSLADLTLTDAVRAAAGVPVAAVLLAPRLPVDIRHNAKVDRARVAAWADAVLAGRRAGRL